jgi:hypothetical protein
MRQRRAFIQAGMCGVWVRLLQIILKWVLCVPVDFGYIVVCCMFYVVWQSRDGLA